MALLKESESILLLQYSLQQFLSNYNFFQPYYKQEEMNFMCVHTHKQPIISIYTLSL